MRLVDFTPKRARVPVAAALLALATGCGDARSGGAIQRGTLVRLADGLVQGTVQGGARRFLGIPFAAPPVGSLRFRPPTPAIPWQGVREANAFGPACAQTSSIITPRSENEDCLYLNVWTPDPAPSRPLPVMVWIHGGGNNNGSANDPVPLGLGGLFYDGRQLAETRDVVVVSINYRVNLFGFFPHSSLAAEDRGDPHSGNQGLLDQQQALRWVRDNVAAFGGDPGNVTIFGESAGAFNVCFHVASPGSRGLFHRAISQSGGCTTYLPTAAEAEARSQAVIDAVGCGGASDVPACLRDVPVARLLDYAGESGPIVDGRVLPAQPRALFARGDVEKVPWILGSNSDEGTFFLLGTPKVTTEAEYLASLRGFFGDRAPAVAEVYPASAYPEPQDALARAYGDFLLVCSTQDSARRAADAGMPVYLYNFSRPIPLAELAPLDLRATHGAEVAYVFGSVPPPTEEDARLSSAMQGYWTRFARGGDPNGGGATPWPLYDPTADPRLDFDVEIGLVSGFRERECRFWRGVYDDEFPTGDGVAAGRGRP
ncbi:MAG: carboxylesterase family protein [Deltaproteobacteria bacterium]|nr:carboxylesterase family protein [Deltaproteobacteria bacterium]